MPTFRNKTDKVITEVNGKTNQETNKQKTFIRTSIILTVSYTKEPLKELPTNAFFNQKS